MTKLKTLTPFNTTSALQGSSTHRVPEPQSGRHNLEEKLTDANKTKHGTEDIKPLHGDRSPNIKSTYEVLKPLNSNNSPEVSFSNEGPQIWNDYVDFKSMRKSSIPIGSNEESEIPLSPPQFCNIYYESQKIPSSVESLETWDSSETENIYETIDTWINDRPDPKPKEKSTNWYSSKHSKMLPGNEYQMDECCSKTSNIGIDSEISEKLPSLDTPLRKMIPMPPPARKSPNSQSNNANFSNVMDELKDHYPTNQLNNETSRMRYSSERSKKPPTDEFSEIHLYNKPPEIGYTYKSSEPKPSCERSTDLCDNSDSMCKGESLDTPLRKTSPKPLSARKSPNSQSNNVNFSDVIDELRTKLNKIKT
ncbi:uncharacterized protein [Aquarana catesbeiana]|uniref:uncharacterized protein n=1 Tax=Aquarana catesbeiana TaxID=8400 RepID=UPI003CC9A793